MRVTQSMIANNSLRHLSNTYGRLGMLQEQLNTGIKISRPSDDPVVAMKSLAYRTNVKQNEQYKRNFTEAHNWIDNSDAALDQATKAMQRIRDLTESAANGTLDQSQRDAIAEEIKELTEQLANIANTEVAGRYIFNGTDTDASSDEIKKPVTPKDDGTFDVNNNNEAVKIELSKGIEIPINVTNVFTQELFNKLKELTDAIEGNPNDENKDIGSYLGDLDIEIDNLLTKRASLGARANRIDLMENRIDQQEEILKKMVADNEGVEYEKVITELVMEESMLRASLSVSARIVQPTLVDFLR